MEALRADEPVHFSGLPRTEAGIYPDGSGLHLEHAPRASAAHIGEVEFAGCGRDDFERPGRAGTRQVGEDVRPGG